MTGHPIQPAAESAPEFGTDVALRAFDRPGGDGRRAAFDAGHPALSRHPRELPSLAVALLTVGCVIAAASLLSWVAGLVIFGVLCLTAVLTRLTAAQQLARAAEVTPTQFGHLYSTVAELRERFSMPRTRVFVVQSPEINAVSAGFLEPYVIVLNSALVDALDAQELKSVIGHEMGHIKLGHTRLSVLLGGLEGRGLSMPFPLNLVGTMRDLIFLLWQRSTEMSADRAGIIACGRPSKAISAQVKLSVGPTLYQHVNLEDLALQAADLHSGVRRVEGFLSQLGASHPFLINRIQAMLDFVSQSEPLATGPLAQPTETPTPARLVVRSGAQEAWQHELGLGPLVAGRSPQADLRLDDRSVSRRHFEITWAPDRWVLRDLGSNNGTFVNGERVTSVQLRDGDLVRVGLIELQFDQQPRRPT